MGPTHSKDPTTIRSNAKKMSMSDGFWLNVTTQLCAFEAVPREANAAAAEPAAAAAAEPAAAADEAPETAGVPAGAATQQTFTACAKFKILECNPRVVSDPDLLWRRPHDQAFLVVGALHTEWETRIKQEMMSEAQFCKARGVEASDLRCGYFELDDYSRIHARTAAVPAVAEAAAAAEPVEAEAEPWYPMSEWDA